MQELFNENIQILRKEIQETNSLTGAAIEYYEGYFNKIKTTLSSLIRYSRLICEGSELDEEINKLVESIEAIFDTELNEIKMLRNR
jgi:uncharacterized protein YdcH (DUF465 family)